MKTTSATTTTLIANALLAAFVIALVAGTSCAPPDDKAPAKLVHVGLSVDGFGRVVSAPTALDCGTACAGDFPEGTHLTLQARPEVGSLFGGWDGDCLGEDGPIVDRELKEDLVCVAHFVAAPPPAPPEMHTLTVVALGPGHVEAASDAGTDDALSCRDQTCRGTFTENSVVSLSAFADPGSDVVGFSGDCSALSSTAGQVTLDEDRVCTVSFFSQGDVTYPLRLLVVGDGRVDATPGNLSCTSADTDCEARYAGATVVTLTATPPAGGGSSFREWGQACAGLAPAGTTTLAIEVDFGVACTAIFDRSVELAVVGQGTIAAPGRSCTNHCSVAIDGSFDVVATPDAGYVFSGFSGDCTAADATATTATVPADAHQCTVTFTKIPPTITVVVDGAGSVTSSDDNLATTLDCPNGACGSDVINHPELVDPDPQAWTCNAFLQGSGTGCNCGCGLVDPDCASPSVDACGFLLNGCDRDHIVEDQNNLCYVEPHGGVPSVTLTAAAQAGSTFAGWSGACSGTDPTVDVAVPDSVSCTATFTTP